jgi:TetR/AcrR family transcriptional regulator, transcriptional repressor for nem operon
MPLQKTNRAEIITRSLDVFVQQGYHRTSMSQLAEACGLLKGSFYHYFESKEVLMREILQWVRADFEQRIFSIACQDTMPPGVRLERMIRLQWRIVLHEANGCFFGNLTLETIRTVPEFREELQAFFDRWQEVLTMLYSSVFPPAEARQWALKLIMEMEGALVLYRLRPDMAMLETCLERALAPFGQAAAGSRAENSVS